MKRILLMVPSLQLGGHEHMVCKTVDALQGAFDITVLIFDGREQVFEPNCNIIDINVPAQNALLTKIFNIIRRTIKVKAIKRELKIDICISFGAFNGANLINALTYGHGKTMINLRTSQLSSSSSFASWLFSRCDRIICCSHALSYNLSQKYKKYSSKFVAINNCFDLELMHTMASEEVNDYAFDHPTIVMHGRLDYIKNIERLLRAFYIVCGQISNVKLLILGEGPQREVLEQMVRALSLTTSVTLIGFRSNPYKYLARSTVYTLTSLCEGFPNALVEGMAFLPVVSVDCKTGPREILCSSYADQVASTIEYADYGILVPQIKDMADTSGDLPLAQALASLLNDKNLYDEYKVKANQRAHAFSYSTYRKQCLQLFDA